MLWVLKNVISYILHICGKGIWYVLMNIREWENSTMDSREWILTGGTINDFKFNSGHSYSFPLVQAVEWKNKINKKKWTTTKKTVMLKSSASPINHRYYFSVQIKNSPVLANALWNMCKYVECYIYWIQNTLTVHLLILHVKILKTLLQFLFRL